MLYISIIIICFLSIYSLWSGLCIIASSLANYIILNIAGILTKNGGTEGPLHVILLNIEITFVDILLALFVNSQYRKGNVKAS